MAKSIFVADDERTAKRYATDPKGPYRFYYHSLFTKLQRGGRAIGFKTDREQPDEALNVPTIVEQLVIYGTPERVTDQLLALREQVGDFGTLLYAGHDWTDKHRARRSMELMAAKVMPASTPRSARARQSPDRKTHPMGCRVMAGLDPVLGWRSCDSHARAESGVNSLATGLTRHPPSEKAPGWLSGTGALRRGELCITSPRFRCTSTSRPGCQTSTRPDRGGRRCAPNHCSVA